MTILHPGALVHCGGELVGYATNAHYSDGALRCDIVTKGKCEVSIKPMFQTVVELSIGHRVQVNVVDHRDGRQCNIVSSREGDVVSSALNDLVSYAEGRRDFGDAKADAILKRLGLVPLTREQRIVKAAEDSVVSCYLTPALREAVNSK